MQPDGISMWSVPSDFIILGSDAVWIEPIQFKATWNYYFFYQSFIFEIRIWQTVFELEFVNLLYIQWYLIINISYSFDYYGLSLLP